VNKPNNYYCPQHSPDQRHQPNRQPNFKKSKLLELSTTHSHGSVPRLGLSPLPCYVGDFLYGPVMITCGRRWCGVDWYDPELNAKVVEFCRHYGTRWYCRSARRRAVGHSGESKILVMPRIADGRR